MIVIGGKGYELVLDHKDGWNPEAFRGRYSEVLDRYDYIIGDWGYSQLRLKGFYRDNHPKVNRDTAISGMVDYINEYCNFGCAYFVLHKLKEVPKEGTFKDILIKEVPEPVATDVEEQELPEDGTASLKENPIRESRQTSAKETPGKDNQVKDRPVREHQSRNPRNRDSHGKKPGRDPQNRPPQGQQGQKQGQQQKPQNQQNQPKPQN
ncbi:YutD family protein [Paenibacillus albidus]|uniref:YutD family protein n=1 Tax=Paenibacillus albidus TaxID=2041023 RepID=UPI001BEAB8E2|nr:YutD family protein [Paenibacillus albidus]MBT2291895.1 YutD family protein [Paenibacillus albidus]